MRDVPVSFDGKRKSFWCLVTPFLKRAFLLQPIERAVHFDGGETLRIELEPFFLRRIAVETVTPAFVVPAAGADVRFASHDAQSKVTSSPFVELFFNNRICDLFELYRRFVRRILRT